MSERALMFGDRNWDDLQLVYDTLYDHLEIEVVIEGECRGADRLSRFAAETMISEHGRKIEILKFPADWNKYGRSAGPIRNQQMLTEGKPTIGICFHDYLEESAGSRDMLNRLLKANIPVIMVRHYN